MIKKRLSSLKRCVYMPRVFSVMPVDISDSAFVKWNTFLAYGDPASFATTTCLLTCLSCMQIKELVIAYCMGKFH